MSEEYGYLKAKIEGLETDLRQVDKTMSALDSKIDLLMAEKDRAQGALKVITWISGILGALGVLAIQFLLRTFK